MVDTALCACGVRSTRNAIQVCNSNEKQTNEYMVGIVIVSYKNAETTASYICEQLVKVNVPWKTIVVDNSPEEDDAREIARRCNGVFLSDSDRIDSDTERDVFVVSTRQNIGFARGNNLGADILVKTFDIDYFLFTNDDIIINDGCVVEKMMDLFKQRPEVGVVGPRIVGRDGIDQSPHYRVITPLRQIGWVLMRQFRNQGKSIHTVMDAPQSGYCYWVSGCFFMVRRSDFAAVNGFDPRTFLYSEEVILAERMKRIGQRVYFMAESGVTHQGGCSTKNLQNKTLRTCLKQSNCIYYRDYLRSNPLFVWLYKTIC